MGGGGASGGGGGGGYHNISQSAGGKGSAKMETMVVMVLQAVTQLIEWVVEVEELVLLV